MDANELKKLFGDEYPAAVIMEGIRLPLHREGRFTRSYRSAEHKLGAEVSRFMDGSASITASELQRDWQAWADDQRLDFCESCVWLGKQVDFPEMLRFIMRHGAQREWSGVALAVASKLPRDEAFDLLIRALRSTEIRHTSNIARAIGRTKHSEAETVLRQHLQALWSNPEIWKEDNFHNFIAFEATTCIAHLIELGVAPANFEKQVRQLSQHVCTANRDSCRNFLSKHYKWLIEGASTEGGV